MDWAAPAPAMETAITRTSPGTPHQVTPTQACRNSRAKCRPRPSFKSVRPDSVGSVQPTCYPERERKIRAEHEGTRSFRPLRRCFTSFSMTNKAVSPRNVVASIRRVRSEDGGDPRAFRRARVGARLLAVYPRTASIEVVNAQDGRVETLALLCGPNPPPNADRTPFESHARFSVELAGARG